jgi:hypothetical protein
MRWTRVKIADDALDPVVQLGSDLDALVDAGEYAVVRKRLLKWQRAIGRPGDKVGRKLAAVVSSSLHDAGEDAASVVGESEANVLEATRLTLAATLVGVNRAYLLSNKFVFDHYWMLDDLCRAKWVYEFLAEAEKYCKDKHLEIRTSFQAPIRSIGSLGWTGSASFRCVGTAGELQLFVDKVCRLSFVGLEPGSIRDTFMEEIPTFAQARNAEGYVVLTDGQLMDGLPGSSGAEKRDSDESFRCSMDELHRLTVEIGKHVPAEGT